MLQKKTADAVAFAVKSPRNSAERDELGVDGATTLDRRADKVIRVFPRGVAAAGCAWSTRKETHGAKQSGDDAV